MAGGRKDVLMPSIHLVDELQPKGLRVLVRVDFNVPLNNGVVTDDTRIRSALPTIQYLLNEGAKVILMSHLGRPKGQGFEQDFSLAPVAEHLRGLVNAPVECAHDITGPDAHQKIEAMLNGSIVVLENLRFDAREKKNDETFCSELASLADVYVNDAFGTAHRAHASTAGVAKLLASYAGFLLNREVTTLTDMCKDPRRPFVAILGGSKVSDKIKVIDSLINTCNTLIIGGGMCFTFLLAQGYQVGASLQEPEWVERAGAMLNKAKEKGVNILLPHDVVVAQKCADKVPTRVVSVSDIPHDMMGLDIGPETVKSYEQAIACAQTIFWNGPMGVFEIEAFEHGTKHVAHAVANNTQAHSIIGGGDSVAAVNKFNLANDMTFISTGGGASMELVQGDVLPGVQALMR